MVYIGIAIVIFLVAFLLKARSDRKEQAILNNPKPDYTEFIEDSRWSNGIWWDGTSIPAISGWKCWGCMAYAADFSKYYFNIDNPEKGTLYKNQKDIKSGDVIHLNNNYGGHYVVIIDKEGDSLLTAEGNVNGKIRIGWNYYWLNHDELWCNDFNTTFDKGWHFE